MCLTIFLSILYFALKAGFCTGSNEQCLTSGFIPNGPYDTNRRHILSTFGQQFSLGSTSYSVSVGEGDGRIYVLGLCIPDIEEPHLCSDCIQTVSNNLLQKCLNQTNSYEYGTDKTLCLVRYSNMPFLDSTAPGPGEEVVVTCGTQNIPDVKLDSMWTDFMEGMITTASRRYYAADTSFMMDSNTTVNSIFAIMQCISGLSSYYCKACLERTVNKYHAFCSGKLGGTMRRASCFFQWENYPMYDAFREKGYSLQSPPLPDYATKNKTHSRGPLLVIVVVIIAAIVIISVIVLLCAKKKKRDFL